MSSALLSLFSGRIVSRSVGLCSSKTILHRLGSDLPRFSPTLTGAVSTSLDCRDQQRNHFGTSASKLSEMTTPAEMKEAQLCDGAFIFNFFLRPVTPDLKSGVAGWAQAGTRIKEHHKDDGKYLSTHLHWSLSEDSRFQVFNFAPFTDFDALPFLIAKDPEAFRKIVGGGGKAASMKTRAIPGGFKEIRGLTRTPGKPSLPKRRPDGFAFVVACFAFEADHPKPPEPGSPPPQGPPGIRPAVSDAITKTRTEFEADWINVSGAALLTQRDAVNEIYLYRRETHGVSTFVLRAECCDAEAAKEAAAELKNFLTESEFLRQNELVPDVASYMVAVNGEGEVLEKNEALPLEKSDAAVFDVQYGQ